MTAVTRSQRKLEAKGFFQVFHVGGRAARTSATLHCFPQLQPAGNQAESKAAQVGTATHMEYMLQAEDLPIMPQH